MENGFSILNSIIEEAPRGVSRMRRWATAVAWLVIVLLVGSEPAAARPAAEGIQGAGAERLSRDWKQLRSRNFLAVGDAADGELRRAVTELEAFQSVLREMFPSVRLVSPVPTLIVVLKDNDTFARFQPRDARGRRQEWVGGYFTALPDVNYMVTGWRSENGLAFDVVFHEFTHYVMNRNLAHVPLWLAESVAEFYSSFRIDTGRNLTLVGETPPLRLPYLRTRAPLPLERILTNESAARLFERDQDRALFYSQSWALVHYLFLGQRGARTKQIGVYLAALEKGRTLDEAFAAAFKCSKEELGQELAKYITDRQYPVLAIKRTAASSEGVGTVEAMREADAEALQADLLSRVGAREDAEKAANRALALQPKHVQATVALARVRRQQDRRDEALAVLQAVASEPGEHFGYRTDLASALMAAQRFEEARVEAARAVAINGQVPSAHYLLALTAAAAGREADGDAAIAQLTRLELTTDHHRRRAYDLFALGRDAAAARDVDAYVRAGWPQESVTYARFLGALARRRLNQRPEADTLLEGARKMVAPGTWTAKVLDFLQGRLTAEDLLSQAKLDGEKTEAHTYIGFRDVLGGHPETAVTHFRWVKEKGSKNYVEYPIAVAELERLEKVKPR